MPKTKVDSLATLQFSSIQGTLVLTHIQNLLFL